MKTTIISWVPRLLLLALFLYSGWSKVIGLRSFRLNLARSPLLEVEVIWLLTYLLPAVELIAAMLLLFERTKSLGFLLCFFLMVFFSLYLISLATIFTNVPCSCGGILGGMSYPVHIAFNIFFTLVALVGIYTCEDPKAARTEMIVNEA